MQEGESFVMADIPGLIENANEGVGLGHQFLRHIERCRLLVHIVDISGSEGRDPIRDFEPINSELEKFNPELSSRPMIVVGNKCDLATDEQIEIFENYVRKKGYDFFPIMAAINYGVENLLNKIWEQLSKLPPIIKFESEPKPIEDLNEIEKRNVDIKVIDGIYVVEANWLLKVMQSINFDDYESLQYFQKVLVNSGIIDALKESGISQGDTVSIYDVEFDFID